METSINHTTALDFIRKYREFEKMPINLGQGLIRQIAPHAKEHLCDHWRWKKRGWGAFFLNSDYPTMIAFLEHWGFRDEAFAPYLQLKAQNPASRDVLFWEAPVLMRSLIDLVTFFENHGITLNPASDVTLTKLPKENKQYGNSKNWGDYLLSLPVDLSGPLIMDIIAHYPNWRAKKAEKEAAVS